jgi:hypothetical protein
MASLNGSTRLVVGEGRAKTEKLDLVVGGPPRIIRQIVKGDSKETTVLNYVVS